jgi:hypothetical protein
MPQQMGESEKSNKRCVYDTLRVLAGKKPVSRSVRIINMFPSIKWHLVWENLSQAVVSDAVRSMWCMVIQDLVLTNVRLHNINLMVTDTWSQCGATDTLIHRLTECGARVEIWAWTSAQLAVIHRTTPRLLLCPAFKFWPRPKHKPNLPS